MALLKTELKRVFKIEKSGVELPDPNPDMSEDEVMKFYSAQYPELTTATVDGPKIDNDKAYYSFKTTIGTKG
jgi:PRTRC genetic system protein C